MPARVSLPTIKLRSSPIKVYNDKSVKKQQLKEKKALDMFERDLNTQN